MIGVYGKNLLKCQVLKQNDFLCFGAARNTGLRVILRFLSRFMEKAKYDNICSGSVKGKWHMDYSWSGNLNREEKK